MTSAPGEKKGRSWKESWGRERQRGWRAPRQIIYGSSGERNLVFQLYSLAVCHLPLHEGGRNKVAVAASSLAASSCEKRHNIMFLFSHFAGQQGTFFLFVSLDAELLGIMLCLAVIFDCNSACSQVLTTIIDVRRSTEEEEACAAIFTMTIPIVMFYFLLLLLFGFWFHLFEFPFFRSSRYLHKYAASFGPAANVFHCFSPHQYSNQRSWAANTNLIKHMRLIRILPPLFPFLLPSRTVWPRAMYGFSTLKACKPIGISESLGFYYPRIEHRAYHFELVCACAIISFYSRKFKRDEENEAIF